MLQKKDILTFKAILLYIIKNSEEKKHDIYRIVKTAFYAQQFHLVNWGGPMFNDNICAMRFGPVPSVMYDILKVSRGDRVDLSRYGNLQDAIKEVSAAIGWDEEYFFKKEEPDMSRLSRSNTDCLDMAIEKVAGMSFNEITDDTHTDEWERAHDTKRRIMDCVGIARDGGANEAMLEYISEGLVWDAICS